MIAMMDGDHQLMLIPCTWGYRAYGNDEADFAAVCTIFQLGVLLNSGKMVGEMLRIFIRKVRYSPRQLKDLFEQRFEAYRNEISAWDTARVSGNGCILELFKMASEDKFINFEDRDYYPKLKEKQNARDGLDDLDPRLFEQFEEIFNRENNILFDNLFGPTCGYDTRWWGAPYGISLPRVKDYLFVLHRVTGPRYMGREFLEPICLALGLTHTTRLLKLTDHNGQTPLHKIAAQRFPGVSVSHFELEVMKYCEPNFNLFDVRDLAGRTCLHYAAANDNLDFLKEVARIDGAGFKNLVNVPFGESETTALQLAVKHNSYDCVEWLVEHGCDINLLCSLKVTLRGPDWTESELSVGAFQMAALAGNLRILKFLLKQPNLDTDCVTTQARVYLGATVPALHLAAVGGNPLSVKILLDSGKIDPFKIDRNYGTALHFVAGWELEDLYTLSASDFVTLSDYSDLMASKKLKTPDANQKGRSLGGIMGCMDMLMQAGLDMEQEDENGQTPQLMSSASDELARWWYDKLAWQNQKAKTNLVAAANAVSVTAALVATASFVGPLTPPLGFSLSTDAWLTGYIQVNHTAVQVFLFCDSLSFYFAIASIMLAMIPSFTIPQEALPLEVRIANRVVRGAVILLFLSIAFVICAFSAATIAVVPESRWHYKVLAVVSTSLGGLVCLIVLCLFLVRLMRLMGPNAGWVRKLTNSVFFLSKKQSRPGRSDTADTDTIADTDSEEDRSPGHLDTADRDSIADTNAEEGRSLGHSDRADRDTIAKWVRSLTNCVSFCSKGQRTIAQMQNQDESNPGHSDTADRDTIAKWVRSLTNYLFSRSKRQRPIAQMQNDSDTRGRDL